jgi:hypothetical protein
MCPAILYLKSSTSKKRWTNKTTKHPMTICCTHARAHTRCKNHNNNNNNNIDNNKNIVRKALSYLVSPFFVSLFSPLFFRFFFFSLPSSSFALLCFFFWTRYRIVCRFFFFWSTSTALFRQEDTTFDERIGRNRRSGSSV